jgi:uncharacterized protein YndB with AHSA1/START domain
MATALAIQPHSKTELVLARILDAPHDKVYRCWTEPDLITQWFTPAPWKTVSAEIDTRPGGKFASVFNGPNGETVQNHGVFLDVAPNARLIFTDAFTRAWQPSGKAFMVVTLTFSPEGEGKTRYIARVTHWTEEDRKTHEAMGFHTGWGIATDQLEALAKTL